MNIVITCEHDDCIVIHDSDDLCPLCKMKRDVSDLESDTAELRSAVNRLEDSRGG